MVVRQDLPRMVRERLDDPVSVCGALGLMKGAKRQAGGGVIVCCPAHNEKHPSCSVRRAKDGTISWKCFSCSASGDALSLIATVHGLDTRGDFSRVLEFAADLAGIQIDGREPERMAAPVQRSAAPERQPSPPIDNAKFQEVIAPLMTLGRLDGAGISAPVCDYLAGRGLLNAARNDGWFCVDPTAGPMLCDVFGHDTVAQCGLVDERGALRWPEHTLAIPWRDPSGTVQTIQRRHLGNCDPKRRYVFPTGRGPSHPYGIERLKFPRGPIALVEGAIDVLAWRIAHPVDRYETPLGVPGVSGWKSDWDAIVRGRFVAIAYDDDDAGNREVARLESRFYAAGVAKVRRAIPRCKHCDEDQDCKCFKDWADALMVAS